MAGDEMIIKTRQDRNLTEIEVLVSYGEENGEVKKLLSLIHSADKQINCSNGNRQQMVNASDIHYIESVDKKTFVYLEKDVLHTEGRIYQLKEELKEAGFVQISKSCLLNLNVLESIRPLMNSRMEALLINGERILVTRKFLGEIKQALREDKK